jgi:hypothetical protein
MAALFFKQTIKGNLISFNLPQVLIPPLSRGRLGGGWVFLVPKTSHPHPDPPLEGEGENPSAED